MAGGLLNDRSSASLLDLVGSTPLVELLPASRRGRCRALREARGPEPDRLDQGPRREGDDRGRRGLGRARARPRAARADERQHRHLARARRQAEGLPAHVRHAGERDRGAAAAAAALRRGDRRLARRGGLERRRARRARARRARARATSCPSSTRTRRTRARTTRARAPRSPRRSSASTCSSAGLGTGGTLMGAGERLRERFPERRRRGGRAAARRPGHGPALARGRLRAADPRRLEARPEGARLERGVGRRRCASCSTRRASSAACRPARWSTWRGGSPASSTRASSSACSPTAAGSTSRPTSGRRPTSSARWSARSGGSPRRDPRRSSTSTRAPRRRTRPAASSSSGTAWPSATCPADNATPQSRTAFELEPSGPRGLVPRGRGVRARRLPLAPLLPAAPVAHGRRERRPLARAAVPDPQPGAGRARRLADHGGRHRAARRDGRRGGGVAAA